MIPLDTSIACDGFGMPAIKVVVTLRCASHYPRFVRYKGSPVEVSDKNS